MSWCARAERISGRQADLRFLVLSGISPFDADTAKQVAKNVRKVNYTFEAAWISIIFNHFIHFLFILYHVQCPQAASVLDRGV